MALPNDLLGAALRARLVAVDRRRAPCTDGSLTLPGLQAPVQVLRDRWGVPHLYAQGTRDLYLAQGFVHAQDRLWQMELHRRLATGRLSEMLGEPALDTDRTTRTMGFARLAHDDWASADPETVQAVAAYTEGVNAYLSSPEARKQRPLEFSLLRHEPEAWRPEDSMAFGRMMQWVLSHAWYGEIVRAQVIAAVGVAHAAELESAYPSENPVVLPEGVEFNRLGPGGILEAARGPYLSRGMGSNAWAVSGRRSATGHALLCNDMHLTLSTPGLWYLAHHEAGDLRVTGATLAGLPMITVGHNARIAWGMTLAFTDCEDLFVERFAPPDRPPDAPVDGSSSERAEGAGRPRYAFQDGWREATVIREEIHVKGRREPHVESVVVTHHGPVISDVAGVPGQRLAIQSMALRPGQPLDGWLHLSRASDWDSFVEAMALIEGTPLNVTYADVDGNTGYWVTGRVPVRAGGEGTVPAAGWTGEAEWVGQVPFEEMPHTLNPAAGYLVNCNQRIVDDDYPHFLGAAWMNGYRARRIVDVLQRSPRLSVDDCRALQMDVTCLPGAELAAQLDGFDAGEPLLRLALERLRAWDGQLGPESCGGAIYEALRHALVGNLLEPALGPDLAWRRVGQGFHPVLVPASELHGHDTVVLLRMLGEPESWWVTRAGGRVAWVRRSLAQATDRLIAEMGPDMDAWQWGGLHHTLFPHTLGAKAPLDRVFSLGTFPVGGDDDTPCQTAMLPQQPYDNRGAAATFREIIDLGDLSRSLVMIPPGQSGRLASPHYDDLVQPWLRGEYIPMLWTREQVEAHVEGRLVLRPPAETGSPAAE